MADNWTISQEIDLARGAQAPRVWPEALMACGDDRAHTWRITILKGGKSAAISGTVTGYFIRADDATVTVAGQLNGNVATVTLSQSCYSVEGNVAAIMRLKTEDGLMTLGALILPVRRMTTDRLVDPEHIVPSLEDLLAQIERIEAATDAANTATTNANNAASKADSAATSATSAASSANAAAGKADDAAAAIDGMTASATTLAAGSAATAAVSDVSGHKHIAIGVPKGDTGSTPQIAFTVSTGEPGTQVQLSQGGTAEAPTVHLTIPRGDTGSVDGLDYYAGTPAALGTGSPGTANGVARGDHVHPMPTAADVGALAEDAAAADADKLGGKTLSDIMLAIYPVGAVYMSTVSTSPATLFGGTWEQIKDAFLLAAGDTYSAGSTGGEASVTLTVEQMPSHAHTQPNDSFYVSWGSGLAGKEGIVTTTSWGAAQARTAAQWGTNGSDVANQFAARQKLLDGGAKGNGEAHNNMPPYLAVYAWRRTA